MERACLPAHGGIFQSKWLAVPREVRCKCLAWLCALLSLRLQQSDVVVERARDSRAIGQVHEGERRACGGGRAVFALLRDSTDVV